MKFINIQLFAHKKGGGSTKNGRDSNSKRFDGQQVLAGTIIIRQRGTKVYPGVNCGLGKDYTIFATADGKVKFSKSGDKKIVSVIAE